MGVSAAGAISGQEFCDFTLALGGDDGRARSLSRARLCPPAGRSRALALSVRLRGSGAWGPRLVARSIVALDAHAGIGNGPGGFGTQQFSRHVLDHGADADSSRQ